MILEGNERGFGQELARHLMNPRDNDHVTVHSIEGFIAADLYGAFAEAEAISGATQCSNYLLSLSLNPPEDESVSVEVFEQAIADVEKKLGLVGQPRAIVFHEKNGRRHAHCVWSRINTGKLKAITLPHYKRKLFDLSRELYRDHDWHMPEGFRVKENRNRDTYKKEEAGQAKRLNRDVIKLKAMFRRCWEQSDSKEAFAAALKEQGFVLARGDRRGFVAVDADGKIWSLSRWCDVKPKDLRARLGNEDTLPSVEEALALVRDLPSVKKTHAFVDPALDMGFAFKRSELIARQREERAKLLKSQEQRRIAVLTARQAKLKGLRGLFSRMTGSHTKLVAEAEKEAAALKQQERAEQQSLIDKHLGERRALTRDAQSQGLAASFVSTVGRDPRQSLELPADDLPFTKQELLKQPELVLGHISKTKAKFERTDILKALARRIDDPITLKVLADKAIQSPQLVKLENGTTPVYTTQDYCDAEDQLKRSLAALHGQSGFGVASHHITDAIHRQNKYMKRAFGGKLSDEQQSALKHVLGNEQCAMVVGLAGAGKSTLLATAKDAWDKQGITVHGAALAGKAADGLEEASNIPSRTLASLEISWENGFEPIKKGDVLVIDEAGMISTRQMARIAVKMEQIGAKLVLVGDPDQLQPIEAGTPFREALKTNKAAHLTEIHRQKQDWQKQASKNLATGKISEAVQAYKQHQSVFETHTRDETLDALVEAYTMDVAADAASDNASDTEQKTSRLAFAHKRKDVHALNQAIRTALRDPDDKENDILLKTETGTRAFTTGDRIVFSRNDKTLGVKNGMLGTVTSAGETELTVTLDGDTPRTITFDPRRYAAFDHGYAVTIHKSQGATVDQAYILASRSMDRHLAYVAMTRHRSDMRLYINAKDRPRWARHSYEREWDVDKLNRDDSKQRKPQRSGPTMG